MPLSEDDTAWFAIKDGWRDLLRSVRHERAGRYLMGALLRGCEATDVQDGILTLSFHFQSHLERFVDSLPEYRFMLLGYFARVAPSVTDIRLESKHESPSWVSGPEKAAF
jgi:hypothetical protein